MEGILLSVTIKDIAAAVGLSTASVSRILNGRGRYSAASAKRVQAAAAELGYFKNRSAADLASPQQRRTIGVINYLAATNANDQVIQGILAEARERDVEVTIMYAQRDNQASITRVVKSMIERQVFAVLFLSVRPDQTVVDTLRQARIYPQEVASASDLNISSVSSDDFQIGYQATDLLLRRGYRRIAFVGADPQKDIIGRYRYAGYTAALQAYDVTPAKEWLFIGDGQYSYHSGLAAVTDFSEHPQTAVDAVFATSDDTALGIVNGLYDLGRPFSPGSLAVIGVDGSSTCTRARPQLSSMTQSFDLIGRTAVAEAVHAGDQVDQIKRIEIPFTIEERQTTPTKK
ncbi:PurR family transcriptional regulator [Schleiferilactobacillus perolens DSM 12744]|uniref:PurR family transcriptional regulator n=1 Tax=Schleiferilactobacillus perolens DSM 12744 TaxID=1423792 RepID=A0A0R1MSS9_9LACO|nr:PurR family transcriptional regulator [Schleiferilactobacillus perolens DSM 12744]